MMCTGGSGACRFVDRSARECSSKEDGCLYRVRADRVICRVVEGKMVETIDSLPLKLPAGAHVLTGGGWGFRMPIGVFYQQIIGKKVE